METWFFIPISISIALLLKFLCNLLVSNGRLPPGPATVPFIANLQWIRKSFFELEPILRSLHAKYGPIITLQIGSRRTIYISSNSLAHKALVQNGAIFADRPAASPVNNIMSSNYHNVSSALYGPTWRFLRRNLTAEILHPSRVKTYSHPRRRVMEILMSRLGQHSKWESVRVVDHFRDAMFSLLVLMCFGDKVDEGQIREIERVQRQMLLSLGKFRVLEVWPRLGKILFRRLWEEFLRLRKDQVDTLLPHIRARQRLEQDISNKCYVDTLLDLQLPEENRKLKEMEMVSLCSEFLNGGTDTTSTALQWIMANLVKNPTIQAKLLHEMKETVMGREVILEDDLQKMPYLKAVVLEGLRRHPPAHFALPHSVTEDVNFQGYFIPKNETVNFMVSEMNWNPEIWEDPMKFKPERFLENDGGGEAVFDVTGSKEIKMMPFGAGRRICPGYGLAMLHLEYFVGNLVWKFEWKAVDGDEVDLSEKQEFTIVMKNPLKVNLTPRWK